MTRLYKCGWRQRVVGLLFILAVTQVAQAGASKKSKTNSDQLRTAYIARLQQQDVHAVSGQTVGSLWSPVNTMGDLSTDYKAHKLNDTIVILVAVQTTAAQSGDSNYQRTVQTSSAITGLAGALKTTGLNPLLNANSSTALKGAGATDTSTTFQTSLTGQVIAVLPSGNLVVEAQRNIFMNNQHEDVTVRGVVRPNDIGPSNMVSSASLSNLEIEMKGKGIIADSTRPLNPITKALLWLVGF
ncbi:MAG TPA: flagellar basal body L-ring protein FlgH [Acidobacteriaceae bacterium]|jgi:flagellar L-ring protein precursor FlgH|nr:flagellar basal body L-ring protein FlgH [Acidobacteriaceae bacterium]